MTAERRQRRRRPARRARQSDPAARAARRARAGLWLRRGSLVAVLAAVVAGGAWGTVRLLAPETFPLRAVYFESRLERVREADLRRALEGHLQAGFWGLDVDRIRAALETLPWVRAAAVRRVWPGELRVQIREHEAVAVWNDEALLSAEGVVFDADEASWPDDLPALSGPEGRASAVVERYRALERAVGGVRLAVAGVTMDARESWSVRLDGGATLRLGREDIGGRVRRFVDAYPEITRRRDAELARADLRYPNGFSVRWQNPTNNAPN